jgi:hypothetical protein
MFEIVKSSEFLRDVVEPDYLEAAHAPESVRHAFHFMISLFSLRDWVREEFMHTPSWRYGSKKRDFQRALVTRCPEFAIVSDLANSAKHSELEPSKSETGKITGARLVRISGGDGFSGFGALGEGPLGSVPMVEVEYGNDRRPVFWVGEKVLFMWRELFAENSWQ